MSNTPGSKLETIMRQEGSDELVPSIYDCPTGNPDAGTHWLEDAEGRLYPCTPAKDGEDGSYFEIDMPVPQYAEPPARVGTAPLPPFGYPFYHSLIGHWTKYVTPDFEPLVDGWEDGCYLSTSSTDWDSKNPGPVNAQTFVTPRYFTKKYGYFQSTALNSAGARVYNISARDVTFKYIADSHELTIESSTPEVSFEYTLSEYDIDNSETRTEQTSHLDSIQLAESTIRFSLRVYVLPTIKYGATYAGWNHAFPEVIIGDPRVGVENTYDYFDAQGYLYPTIAVLAATTDNEAEMPLRVYPVDCDLYVYDGIADHIETVVGNGYKYDSPLDISTGRNFTVYAKHRTIKNYESPLYRIVIPSPVHGNRYSFHRMYTFGNPPTMPGFYKLGHIVFERPTNGWFVSPNSTGDGTSPDTPGSFSNAISNVAAGQTIYALEGVYDMEDIPNYNTLKTNVAVIGGYYNNFNDRDVHAHKSVLRQTGATEANLRGSSGSSIRGFYAEAVGDAVADGTIEISLFPYSSGTKTIDCHVENLYYVGPSKAISIFQAKNSTTERGLENSEGCNCGDVDIDITSGNYEDVIQLNARIGHSKNVKAELRAHSGELSSTSGLNLTVMDCENVSLKIKDKNGYGTGVTTILKVYKRTENIHIEMGKPGGVNVDAEGTRFSVGDSYCSIAFNTSHFPKNIYIKTSDCPDIPVIERGRIFNCGSSTIILSANNDYLSPLSVLPETVIIKQGNASSDYNDRTPIGIGGTLGKLEFDIFSRFTPFFTSYKKPNWDLSPGNPGTHVYDGEMVGNEIRIFGNPLNHDSEGDLTFVYPWFSGDAKANVGSRRGGNGAPVPGLETPGNGPAGEGKYLGDYWQEGVTPY